MNEKSEEYIKLCEELKDVQFHCAGISNPKDLTLEDLQDIKQMVDYMKDKNRKSI